jgi:uncharacterized protein (DUF427 family)
MSARVQDLMWSTLDTLRHEHTDKRVRGKIGDREVVDSTSALLVWEPRRIAPFYAVPLDDVAGELRPAEEQGAPADAPMLHPGIPFSAHSTEGEPLDLQAAGKTRSHAAFRPADPDLSGLVLLDSGAFDSWYEEDEEVHSHPRDPFHRVDVRHSSRPLRIEIEGELVAETTRPTLAFETNLHTRFYFPREDLKVDVEPTSQRTYCPYKGEASYWAFDVGGRTIENLLWSYEDPLEDAAKLSGLMALFDEVVDVTLDGVPRERPDTPVARVMIEEFGLTGPDQSR